MDLYYENTTSSSYNLSTACNATGGLFRNLTPAYIQQLHDPSTLSASFIMFALTALFFILNLFSGLSDVSAILDPKVRVGLSSALTLFLPVMSYLFSEAKNNGGGGAAESAADLKAAELPQRARFILIWMLLVELLRKKVEEIRMQGYSGTLERAGRVVWLGSLVFSNLQATGRKATTGILWVLCVSNLVQRVSFTEFGKRSLAFGKNARLIASYMAQVLEQKDGDQNKDEAALKRCRYAVMDEDKLVVEATPNGYKLKKDHKDDHKDAATVGRIWERAETDRLLGSLDRDQRLRRLCLSFALFKLLRRRFEHLPALTTLETQNYRQLVFRTLRETHHRTTTITAEEAFFEVTNDELSFVGEYYHSVIPVVLASPFFLLANYFLVPLVVLVLCLVFVVLCGNGDVPLAVGSMRQDNYVTFFGVTQMRSCLPQVFHSPIVFFCTVDLAITFLLFLMFLYGEVREFFVFLFSDWFLVSMVSKYATDQFRGQSHVFGASVRCILFARSLLHRPAIGFNQFSLLEFCGVTMPAHLPFRMQILVRTADVPKEAKHAVAEYFTKLFDRDGNLLTTTAALSNGRNVLLASPNHADLLPFCKSDSVAEVILTWHIATSYLEVECRHGSSDVVATTLSKYCAYLVAFHPELLPENQDSVERVFTALKLELYDLLGFWGYHLCPCRNTRHNKIKSSRLPDGTTPEAAAAERKVVVRGATLGSILAERAARSDDEREGVWKVLADLWVDLIVYVAPASDEECVAAHENVLAKGGEFVTLLWAMVTHAGITRPPPVTTSEGAATTPV